MFELAKKEVNVVIMRWYVDNLKDKIKFSSKELHRTSEFNDQVLEKVVSDIINDLSIGIIAITEDYELIDGYKRIIAINSFIDGKITCNGKYYIELSDEEKNIFDNYQLPIFVGGRN